MSWNVLAEVLRAAAKVYQAWWTNDFGTYRIPEEIQYHTRKDGRIDRRFKRQDKALWDWAAELEQKYRRGGI